jgi:hypothetical protein
MVTYVISVLPGRRPVFSVLGPDGVSHTLVHRFRVPKTVRDRARWLSAFAERQPLPNVAAPPVVITPTRLGEPYIVMVEVDGP